MGFVIVLVAAFAVSAFAHPLSNCVDGRDGNLTIVDRQGWEARPPTSIEALDNPVPYVVIHHSYIPGPCYNDEECKAAMRSMQKFHMDTNGWVDIGYNFGVGGNGLVYEGRGWSRVGAHAPNFNVKSIGICTIGDFVSVLPPQHQLDSIKSLIAMGVEKGYIAKDYKLIGHRQTRPTECPGQALYDEIVTWPHYSPDPKRSNT